MQYIHRCCSSPLLSSRRCCGPGSPAARCCWPACFEWPPVWDSQRYDVRDLRSTNSQPYLQVQIIQSTYNNKTNHPMSNNSYPSVIATKQDIVSNGEGGGSTKPTVKSLCNFYVWRSWRVYLAVQGKLTQHWHLDSDFMGGGDRWMHNLCSNGKCYSNNVQLILYFTPLHSSTRTETTGRYGSLKLPWKSTRFPMRLGALPGSTAVIEIPERLPFSLIFITVIDTESQMKPIDN